MDQLHKVAQFLFEHEKMAQNEFEAMMQGLPMPEKPDYSIYHHAAEPAAESSTAPASEQPQEGQPKEEMPTQEESGQGQE